MLVGPLCELQTDLVMGVVTRSQPVAGSVFTLDTFAYSRGKLDSPLFGKATAALPSRDRD